MCELEGNSGLAYCCLNNFINSILTELVSDLSEIFAYVPKFCFDLYISKAFASII